MPNSNPPVLRISEMNTQTENGGLSDRDVLTAGPKYNEPPKKTRIRWYRCRVTREALRELNRRSDFFGSAQTLGFFGRVGCWCGRGHIRIAPLAVVHHRAAGLHQRSLLAFFGQWLSRTGTRFGLQNPVAQSLLASDFVLFGLAQPPSVLGESHRTSQIHPASARRWRSGLCHNKLTSKGFGSGAL